MKWDNPDSSAPIEADGSPLEPTTTKAIVSSKQHPLTGNANANPLWKDNDHWGHYKENKSWTNLTQKELKIIQLMVDKMYPKITWCWSL